MTAEICSTANSGDTKQLIDSRDSKKYWVAKLDDGRCWMTQNMELDLTSRTLTSADSDVVSEYTFDSDVMHTRPLVSNFSNTSIVAWNFGDYVRTTPSTATSSTYCNSIPGLSGCTDYFTNVADMTPMAAVRTDDVAVSGNTYDAHFKTGYYYSWNAATASSSEHIIVSGQAPNSICPKGWELPTSNATTTGSFYYFLVSLGSIMVSRSVTSSPPISPVSLT